MGILNLTSDSFYDGGSFVDPAKALNHFDSMIHAGATIIDIGAESTRPGSREVSVDKELSLLKPFFMAEERTSFARISVDTRKAKVASWAIAQGVHIINDVSALRYDSEMVRVIADSEISLVIMHSQGSPETMQDNPQYDDPISDICDFIEERLEYAQGFGIPLSRMIVDPGIGFGKTLDHNFTILRNLSIFKQWGCPLLLGASRKRFLAAVLDTAEADRLSGTLAVSAWAFEQGVDILRVHDVKETADVLQVLQAITQRK
jgi:dihydropteroate synthase